MNYLPKYQISTYAILVTIFIFIIGCSNKDDNWISPSSASVTPGINVINTSRRFNTSDITSSTTTAPSRMSNQAANIKAVTWDLGSTSQTTDSRNENFNTYNVVLISSEIETMITGQNIWDDGAITTSV